MNSILLNLSRYHQSTDSCAIVNKRRKSSGSISSLQDMFNNKPQQLDSFTDYARLIFHMLPDGSWKLTEDFATVISVSYHNLTDSCPFNNLIRKDEYDRSAMVHFKSIWATTLALAWLQSHCEKHKEEWQIAATKSQFWLLKQALPKGLVIQDLTIIAETTLKSLNTWKPQKKPIAYWNQHQRK